MNSSHSTFWYVFNISALILSLFFVLFIPLVHGFQDFTKTVDIMLKAHGTEADTYTIELANASSTPLNAIEFELSYNPEELTITDIVSHGVLCEERFIITNSVDNSKGHALFQCGTITPFTSATGTVATIHTQRKIKGMPVLSFGETTHVLAHDGYGTDATRYVTIAE